MSADALQNGFQATTRRSLQFGPLWLAAPGIAFLIVFFMIPVLRLLGLSFQDSETASWSSDNYARIVSTDVYFRVLLSTFRIAGLTAALSLLFGYPLAYWLAKLPDRMRGKAILAVMVPFWTSYLVKTFAWMVILGREGVANQVLAGTGLPTLPLLHNEFGVMVGMVHAMLPLAVLTMLPVMTTIDRRLIQAAETLGGSPAHAFWMIYFQLSLPGVAAAGLLTFISSLGFFIVPALLGGPQQTMLAQLIISQIQEISRLINQLLSYRCRIHGASATVWRPAFVASVREQEGLRHAVNGLGPAVPGRDRVCVNLQRRVELAVPQQRGNIRHRKPVQDHEAGGEVTGCGQGGVDAGQADGPALTDQRGGHDAQNVGAVHFTIPSVRRHAPVPGARKTDG